MFLLQDQTKTLKFLTGKENLLLHKNTSSFDCKHKHMLCLQAHVAENGAPDKFGVLYRPLYREFHTFTNRIYASGFSLFGSWY